MTTPYRIEYHGPEGWTVWTDEDGVHVRTPKGDNLEAPDVEHLIRLVHEARSQRDSGAIPVPKPPDAEVRRALYGLRREEYDAKRASKAVYRVLSPDADTVAPF